MKKTFKQQSIISFSKQALEGLSRKSSSQGIDTQGTRMHSGRKPTGSTKFSDGKILNLVQKRQLPGCWHFSSGCPNRGKKSIEQIQCVKIISTKKTFQQIYYHLEIKRKSVTKTVLLILAWVYPLKLGY